MNTPELSSATWRKSSRSGGDEGSCIEVASVWRKSSHSGGDEGECIELAATSGRLVAARDSKDPSGPVLCFGQGEWRAFCAGIKSGSYEL